MFSSKVFRRYLVLFVSVALLACTLAGAALMYLSSHEMQRTAQYELEKRRTTAAQDYAAQIKRLDELALRLSLQYKCSPNLVRQGVMQELDMMEVLKKHRGTSLWNENIILYYPNSDAFFTPKAKYRSHYFSNYLIHAEDSKQLIEQIENAQWGEWMKCDSTHSLLVFPLRYAITGERMYCLFQVEHRQISTQTAFVSALESGITAAGQPIPQDAYPVIENDLFCLWVSAGDTFKTSHHTLMTLSIALIAALSLIFVSVAVFLAYRCYLPIQKMTVRFLSGEALDGNELDTLSSALNQAIRDKNYSQRLLVEQIHRMDNQKESFRSQLLLLLLNGQATGDMLSDAGIKLPGPYYTLMLIGQPDSMPFAELKKLVEELSDESFSFCAVETENGVVVLCSLRERTQLMDAVDMLNAAGEASGGKLSVRAGQVCTSLTQLSGMLTALLAGDDATTDGQGAPRWYDDGSLNLILNAIRQGRTESAREQMSILIRSVAERHMPDALRRCAYIDIFNRMIQCALDARLPVPGELGAAALEAADEEETLRLFERVIDKMTDSRSTVSDPENSAAAFVRYVDEHACEISFNINCLSDMFGLSAKYIARKIREQTGMPYRNYIIHLRIKEACRLLRSTDTPVCEIHERVGYSSASHFVKVFRTVTGMTPSAYRSDGYLLSPDVMQLDALDDMDQGV